MLSAKELKKVIIIMLAITLSESIWVYSMFRINGIRFWTYLGFTTKSALLGWLSALVVVILFTRAALSLPSVKRNLLRLSGLKVLAVFLAFSAGLLEESFFRKELMDYLMLRHYSWILQVISSGLVFGILHGVWGIFAGNLRAALSATVITGILGAALAIVYLVSGRILAPCIIAHFLIDALLEPGLVIAAVKGEMHQAKRAT